LKPPKILILAAGEGTRMKSDLPKVLHEAAGDALLGYVLRAVAPLKGDVGLVVGRGADLVRRRYPKGFRFFLQKERRGSGHAVKTATRWLKTGGDVLVLCGDAPLIRPETVRNLLGIHRREKNAATLLTARVANPAGYGRIVRDAGGRPNAIVEERDATPDVRRIDEINSGAYCFAAKDLVKALGRLRPDNAKGEYYITDVIGMFVEAGKNVGALCLPSEEEVLGVNRRSELSYAAGILRRRKLEELMDAGVSVVDPAATYVDADVTVGPDTVLFPQTFLKAGTRVGRGARVGPFSSLENTTVGDGSELTAVFAKDAVVGADVKVGPFTHLRPGTRIAKGARLGNFVEIKKASVGPGAKVNHLSYIGDATLGPDVNVGAGTITCNYDGFEKNHTWIGAGAFVGSNVNLVAPVKIGAGAVLGAGSTITRDVPAGALGVERAPQTVKKGWAAAYRRRRAKK